MNIESIMDELRTLSVGELMKVEEELHERWRFYAPKIESHLNDVIQNISNFEKELTRSLT